jgi:hypothetical protein
MHKEDYKMKDKQARARTVFERQEENAQQLENYKMSFGDDKGKLQPAGGQAGDPVQVIADTERGELIKFIVENRGYRPEDIPREIRFLKFCDIELLRQIKQSIENRVK